MALRAAVSRSNVGGRASPRVVHTRWTNTITVVAISMSLADGGQASSSRSSSWMGPVVAIKAATSCCQASAERGQRVKMWGGPPPPQGTGAVGSGLHPKAGQAAAGGKDVVEQLEHDVCLLPGKLGAPQPGPYVGPGELRPPDSGLRRRGGVHEGCIDIPGGCGCQGIRGHCFILEQLHQNFSKGPPRGGAPQGHVGRRPDQAGSPG